MPTDPLFEPTAILRLFADCNVDAIVATSPQHLVLLTGYGTWLEEKLRGWMSDPLVGNSHQAGFAVLDSALRVGLVASPLFAEEAESSWATSIVYPTRPAAPTGREALDALIGMIRDMGLEAARVGVEFDGAPPLLRQELCASLPRASIRDCSWLLRLARMRKSAEALRRVRDVHGVTVWALGEALGRAPAPDALPTLFRQALATKCVDADHLVHGLSGGRGLSSGSAQVRWPSGLVYLDAGARLHHFYSDIGITVHAAGRLSSSDTARFQLARDGLLAGADCLAPGVSSSNVYRAMAEVIVAEPALRAQGHGLGLDIRELPMIRALPADRVIADETLTASADIVLESGMVVNLEISGFFADGSLQLEQTFEIRADAAVTLGHDAATGIWELS